MLHHSTRSSQDSNAKRPLTRTSRIRTARPRGCYGKNKTEEQRIDFLKSFKYAKSVSEQAVDCGACGQHIQLDKRNGYKYYAENWTKHLNTKKCIRKQQLFESAETQNAAMILIGMGSKPMLTSIG
ncbi:hypothetical protein HYPSUDRAFT_204739 [Hypholoma sublateritium FD-334 SS-4]|uniref:Uncharacterized protein n=1 Tax=Hypholoma sublateritium (strain FD-334 SS-4) TaxID=945553 RepID=A0A0D2M7W6_HYPSF|nr:hypothetical protein HYPSUDRAFT_204739 [Hypholoma sublateritium FD-334 SS-4]